MSAGKGGGPLDGVRIVELGSIGPGPFCGQMLGDLGAEVIVIERPGAGEFVPDRAVERRSKRSIAIDLKDPAGVDVAMRLIARADALIEGFRPGVMERLGLGPDACRAQNPGLVYGRMTGWGQSGPLASRAGHDINYIGLTGALHAMGAREAPPPPPLNLVGDYGGGAMFLAVGILAGLFEAARSGSGQVVDAAIIDGTAAMMGLVRTLARHGLWTNDRAANSLDGGAPFYRCYETSDARFMSVGAIEARFFGCLLEVLEIEPEDFGEQWNRRSWPLQRQRLEDVFRARTRDDWCAIFQGVDACVAPVLDYDEASKHAHSVARRAYVELDDVSQPAPAPRFSRTLPPPPRSAPRRGGDGPEIMRELGMDDRQIDALIIAGVVSAG